MLTKKRLHIVMTISVLLVIGLSACSTTIRGTNTQASYKLQRSLTAPVYWEVKVEGTARKVFDAAMMATKDLSLSVLHQKSDQLTGVIKGYFADGTKFGIKINLDSPGITKLQITAGNTGDKTLVLQIFKTIEKHM
ncbi:MAG: DUF3568 family protein [Anaerolineales bacterium]